MKSHYLNSFLACLFAVMWGRSVSLGNAWLASFNVVVVVFYVCSAERDRRESARSLAGLGESAT